MPLSWLALLFVILGIAVAALGDDDPLLKDLGRRNSISETIRVLSARYLGAATKCLLADHFLWRHNIKTLQTLVLLIYALNQTHGNTWSLLGITYNIALALGCHIDPSSFGLGLIKCEERRRCWAGLMMLYTIQNTAMGNMDSQRLQHQVHLPADVNDIDLMADKICLSSVGATQMSYVLFKFRLYSISSGICQQIFGPVKPSRDIVRALDHEITSEQRSWDTKYLSDSSEEVLPIHHIVNLNILYSYSHQLLLLLHRPFFNRELTNTSYEDSLKSRNRCIDSALAMLDIHKMLCENPQFKPYKWFTAGLNSFHAFHAAVVLAAVWMDPDYRSHHRNIQDKLKETLTRFEGLVYRSTICEKATPILSFLMLGP